MGARKEWQLSHRSVRVLRALLIGLLLLNLCFIFYNSLQGEAASDARSDALHDYLEGFLGSLTLLVETLRKFAHFLEFAAFGFLLTLCLRLCTPDVRTYFPWVLLAGLLTACADETIQFFVPGRSSELKDVWIDFSGVLAGLLLGLLLLRLTRRHWRVLGLRDLKA